MAEADIVVTDAMDTLRHTRMETNIYLTSARTAEQI